MMYVKIPMERVAVLVGKQGGIKTKIEKETGTSLDIDSRSGDVTINNSKASDPFLALKSADIVKAIGRGFSPDKALKLVDEDTYMTLIDIRDFTGKNPKHVRRIRGRLIGARGKTRRLIEEIVDVHVSVYGNTVGVIGESMEMGIALTAIEMLLKGSEHSAVYGFLEKKKRDIEISKMGF